MIVHGIPAAAVISCNCGRVLTLTTFDPGFLDPGIPGYLTAAPAVWCEDCGLGWRVTASVVPVAPPLLTAERIADLRDPPPVHLTDMALEALGRGAAGPLPAEPRPDPRAAL